MPDKFKTPQSATGSEPAEKPEQSSTREVSEFLEKVKNLSTDNSNRGKLIFAMDATMSRQPTWDLALQQQAEMFRTVGMVGGLSVQLVYFRGFDECRASKWVNNPEALARLMVQVKCAGGYTQISRVLTHARQQAEAGGIGAVVYVGDCVEEEIDELAHKAGELALYGVPVFLFQEGRDAGAERAFREIARITKGAFSHFDSGSAEQLKDLLSAVAAFATGGLKALEDLSGSGNQKTRLLLEQLKRK